MAINALIAQGVRPIGADVPQIANMLQEKKQQEFRNSLAKQQNTREQAVFDSQQANSKQTADAKQALAESQWGLTQASKVQAISSLPHVVEKLNQGGIDVATLNEDQATQLLNNVRMKASSALGIGPPEPTYQNMGGTGLAKIEPGKDPQFFSAPQPEKPEAGITPYQQARIDIEREKMNLPPAGMTEYQRERLKLDREKPSASSGGASDKPLTEFQTKALNQLQRMESSAATVDAKEYTPSVTAAVAADIPYVGNTASSKEYQQYRQSAREWISGLLRLDSGAAVPETEFARYFSTYFAQPGDDKTTVAQKKKSRVNAMTALRSSLGPVADRVKPPSNVGTAPPAAIEYLNAHPEAKDAFKQKYGYLPDGR